MPSMWAEDSTVNPEYRPMRVYIRQRMGHALWLGPGLDVVFEGPKGTAPRRTLLEATSLRGTAGLGFRDRSRASLLTRFVMPRFAFFFCGGAGGSASAAGAGGSTRADSSNLAAEVLPHA
jgi:hypothetical protein